MHALGCVHANTIYCYFCRRLEEKNTDELTKEDFAKLEEIFHLLMECTKVGTTPMNSSPLQSPNSDRSVSNILPNKLSFVAPCPVSKPLNTINPHKISQG